MPKTIEKFKGGWPYKLDQLANALCGDFPEVP